MGFFTLKVIDEDMAGAILEKAKTDLISYEKDFENWLENSPNVLFEDDDINSVIWIDRQASASVGETGRYPDLIGIDKNGDLVIVELKKAKTPREVVAQILEYASWGAGLSYELLDEITRAYYRKTDPSFDKSLQQLHREAFMPDTDEEITVDFNRGQKLFIFAEEVSPVVCQVAQYLRTKCQVDIHCVEYEVLKSNQGEYFISTEKTVGLEPAHTTKAPGYPKWSGPIKVKDAITEAVKKFINGDMSKTFKPVEIINNLKVVYPDINPDTVRCQIMMDCVNHTSRKHYPSGQQDLYFKIDKGIFRLYDAQKDGKWNWKGEKLSEPA